MSDDVIMDGLNTEIVIAMVLPVLPEHVGIDNRSFSTRVSCYLTIHGIRVKPYPTYQLMFQDVLSIIRTGKIYIDGKPIADTYLEEMKQLKIKQEKELNKYNNSNEQDE